MLAAAWTVMLSGDTFGRTLVAILVFLVLGVEHIMHGGCCRMLWSFSRDGGVPFHQLWSAINESTQTPILAVWAMVTFAFLLGLPMLHSLSAFSAVTSICSIGLYISCKWAQTPHFFPSFCCIP